MGNLGAGSSVTAVVVNRRGSDGGGGVGGDGDGGGEFQLEKFDGNQDGTMDASELTAIRRARGDGASDRLKARVPSISFIILSHHHMLKPASSRLFSAVHH